MMKTLLLVLAAVLVGCATTPTKELTTEDVAGEYERQTKLGTYRLVLPENGIIEVDLPFWAEEEGKWSISKDGKREEIPKEEQTTLKKIK